MDTISRENNPSILPIVGVGLGVVACILAAVAIAKASPVKKLSADVESLNNQVQSVSGDISAASPRPAAPAHGEHLATSPGRLQPGDRRS
jgi:outer membrane murein-binding lipoprotein Lpp